MSTLNETLPTRRVNLMNAYLDNQVEYLHKLHPDASKDVLYRFVKDVVNRRYREMKGNTEQYIRSNTDLDTLPSKKLNLLPTCKVVRHADPDDETHSHSYGNLTYQDHEDLLKVTKEFEDKIISPSGSFYETTNNLVSFIKTLNDEFKVRRKNKKKLMLQAKKEGNKSKAVVYNNQQASIKITMNSMPGGFGFAHSSLSSAANFNSVTSMGRSVVTNSYAHAERFLAGNFYFPDVEHLINFLVTCTQYMKPAKEVEELCVKHNLRIPKVEDVYEFLINNLYKYTGSKDEPGVLIFLQHCQPGELAFIFYMSNLHNLIHYNDELFRNWFKKLFDKDLTSDAELKDVNDIWKIDGDLLIVLNTLLRKELDVNKSGNTLLITDSLNGDRNRVERFYRKAIQMQNTIDEFKEVFEVFTNHGIGVQYADEHKNMLREVVGTSDTDSILFTTRQWIEWYNNADDDVNINAMIVYLLTKANEHILFHLSCSYNAIGKDRFTIAMKNEFYQSCEFYCNAKKTYASLQNMQEGVMFGTPNLDVKGVMLRGSNFSHETLVYTNWLIEKVLTEISKGNRVDAQEYIQYVLNYERMMYDSLHDGETTFLSVSPIKNANEYKNADSSIFYNYTFWEKVFAKKYGTITIPTKCYIVPLGNIRDDGYRLFLHQKYPEILDLMTEFLNTHTKPITRIPINPVLDTVPEELRPLVAVRDIVYASTRPLYLILKSMGIQIGSGKKDTNLFSDVYGLTSRENGKLARELIAKLS